MAGLAGCIKLELLLPKVSCVNERFGSELLKEVGDANSRRIHSIANIDTIPPR